MASGRLWCPEGCSGSPGAVMCTQLNRNGGWLTPTRGAAASSRLAPVRPGETGLCPVAAAGGPLAAEKSLAGLLTKLAARVRLWARAVP